MKRYCEHKSQEEGGRFYWDSEVKSPCHHIVSNLRPYNPDLHRFAAAPSLQDLAIFLAAHIRPIQEASTLWSPIKELSRPSAINLPWTYPEIQIGANFHRWWAGRCRQRSSGPWATRCRSCCRRRRTGRRIAPEPCTLHSWQAKLFFSKKTV